MKNETRNEGWYGRFLHWAGGEEPDGPEGPEDPERQEFLEYLEYIEAHGDMEFGAYRLMRYRERREKGMEGAQPPADRPAERREVRRPARRRRPGALRRQLRLLDTLEQRLRKEDSNMEYPVNLKTLPQRQVACGLADTFVHVMEQYMTVAGQSRVMDRWAEGILQTLVEIAPEIRENQHDYDLMADFMLSATMGLNGFIAMGVAQDWATHMIGHELTALHGLTHGATLAIVLPGTLRVLSAQKGDKLLQYGERVWGITTGERDERIRLAIERTEGFFRSLGLSTRLSEEGIGEETIAEIERRFDARGARYGEARNVDGAMARRILEACR